MILLDGQAMPKKTPLFDSASRKPSKTLQAVVDPLTFWMVEQLAHDKRSSVSRYVGEVLRQAFNGVANFVSEQDKNRALIAIVQDPNAKMTPNERAELLSLMKSERKIDISKIKIDPRYIAGGDLPKAQGM